MLEPEALDFSPDQFSGIARLFPLPNLVLFPHIVQALHVFEPRYRELLEDALASDRLIAMALLCPGWEQQYEGRPQIREIVCLGRVISHSRQEDGRSNVLLLGLRRARVTYELPPRRAFREAKVELLEDVYPDGGAAHRPRLRRQLLDRFRSIVPKDPSAQGEIEQLLGSQVPLGVLTDLVAYSLDIAPAQKQRMLNEVNVDRRARNLLKYLRHLLEARPVTSSPEFPPEFSAN
jgi:ATP-dependent Lon protease